MLQHKVPVIIPFITLALDDKKIFPLINYEYKSGLHVTDSGLFNCIIAAKYVFITRLKRNFSLFGKILYHYVFLLFVDSSARVVLSYVN